MNKCIFSIFILTTFLFGQMEREEGALIRINFSETLIANADSIDSWYYEKNPGGVIEIQNEKYFTGVFYFNDRQYFLSSHLTMNLPELYSGSNNIYDYYKRKEYPIFDFKRDVIIVYDPQPSFIVDTKKIIYFNFESNGFILNDSDSLRVWNNGILHNSIIHLPGKIKNQYLVVYWTDDAALKHGLLSDIESPYVDLQVVHNISVKEEEYMSKVYQINDSLIISQPLCSNRINFHKLQNDSLHLIGTNDEFSNTQVKWFYKNNFIYFEDIEGLKKTELDGFVLDLENATTLLEKENRVINYDPEKDFCVIEKNKTLTIYDIKNEQVINEIDVSSINYKYDILIDSPYVYLHRIDKIVGIQKLGTEIPLSFKLKQNYPNPFNPSTTIEYEIPETTRIILEIYNILGEKIETLINDSEVSPGKYLIKFNAEKYQSGIYFYKLFTDSFSDSKKMILIK